MTNAKVYQGFRDDKKYQFHNVPPIWPILQKGRTTVE